MSRKLVVLGALMVGLTGGGCGDLTQADTDAPVVFIVSPKADSTVGGTVSFSAQVFDGFGVAKTIFSVDGVVLGEDLTGPPWSVLWNTQAAGNGPHALRVEAIDPAGNTGFNSIGVTVNNARQ